MNTLRTLDPPGRAANYGRVFRGAILCVAVTWLAGFTGSTRATDGCKVLLCFAAPSWRSIPQCVPPIQEVLHDLARGKPFPVCAMSGPANSASHQWSSAPTYCPPQYIRVVDGESGPIYSCDYTGAVAVNVQGILWARTWWSFSGDTVTEFTPAAKTQLGTWDTRFDDDDYAAWLAAQPTTTQSCSSC